MFEDKFFKVYFNAGDAGGTNQNNTDDKNKQQDEGAEETISLKKTELEQRYTNKFAEGAKKAEKSIFGEFGVKAKEELKEKL